MTEMEYNAWCWNNRDILTETWEKYDFDENSGTHIYFQGQPMISEQSLATTFFVKYILGWNGSLDENGLYFSISIENKNPTLMNALSQVVMTISDNTITKEQFFLPVYTSMYGNKDFIEYSLTESKNFPDLARVIKLLQENKCFNVELCFLAGNKISIVHTIISGGITDLSEIYSESAMMKRTKKRLLEYVPTICEHIPLANKYFSGITEDDVVESFTNILLQSSNIELSKKDNENEWFAESKNKTDEDICKIIFDTNRTISLENLIMSFASLFSYGVIELAISRFFIMSKNLSFQNQQLISDVIKNMNNPYFNAMNPKSPLSDSSKNDNNI